MIYKFSATVLFILFLSCKEPTRNSPSCLVEPKSNMKFLLDSFVRVNGQSYSKYGLYIDKTSPHHYDLIVYAGKEPLTNQEDQLNNQKPMQKVRVFDIEFDVYSGMEHYFQNESRKESTIPKDLSNGSENVIWAVKDSFGVMTIYKLEGAYPFIALPGKISDTIKLKLPIEDSSGD